jgi:hypothetical protein
MVEGAVEEVGDSVVRPMRLLRREK